MLHRELLLDSVEMSDWQMVVEQWSGGRHSFPKFASGPAGRRAVRRPRCSTCARSGGEFTFEDHGTPWSTVARNLDINVNKVLGYRGEATFARRHGDHPELRADVDGHEGRLPASTAA